MNTVFVLLCFCFLDYSSYSICRPLYVKKMLRQATIQYDTLSTRNRNKKYIKEETTTNKRHVPPQPGASPRSVKAVQMEPERLWMKGFMKEMSFKSRVKCQGRDRCEDGNCDKVMRAE